MVLGAIMLTRDHRPWEAVYGRPADEEHLAKWLPRTMTIGDFGESAEMLAYATALPVVPVVLTLYGLAALHDRSRPAFAAVLGLGIIGALCVPRQAYEQGWAFVKSGFAALEDSVLMWKRHRGFDPLAA